MSRASVVRRAQRLLGEGNACPVIGLRDRTRRTSRCSGARPCPERPPGSRGEPATPGKRARHASDLSLPVLNDVPRMDKVTVRLRTCSRLGLRRRAAAPICSYWRNSLQGSVFFIDIHPLSILPCFFFFFERSLLIFSLWLHRRRSVFLILRPMSYIKWRCSTRSSVYGKSEQNGLRIRGLVGFGSVASDVWGD